MHSFAQEANWFSAPSALRIYGQYLNLDLDHNGMLSQQELARFGTGTLTKVTLHYPLFQAGKPTETLDGYWLTYPGPCD